MENSPPLFSKHIEEKIRDAIWKVVFLFYIKLPVISEARYSKLTNAFLIGFSIDGSSLPVMTIGRGGNIIYTSQPLTDRN